MITVRKADENDKIDVAFLTRMFVKEAGYTLSLHMDTVLDSYDAIIHNPDCVVFVAENDKEVVGLIIGVLNKTLFSQDVVATEIAWFVDPDKGGSKAAIRLVDAFEEWGVASGAQHLTMSHHHKNDTSKLFTRRGYNPVEATYMKEV